MKVRELLEFNPVPNSKKTFQTLFQLYGWKDETPVGKRFLKVYSLGTRSITVNIVPKTDTFTWEATDRYEEAYNKNAKRAHGSSLEDLEAYLKAYDNLVKQEWDDRNKPRPPISTVS